MSASYTGFTAQANSSTGVEFSKLYDPLHLLRVTQDMMFDKYADARFIPANSGVKTMFAFRYRNLRPATTPLTEGLLPNETTPIREKVDFGVAQYGSFLTYTDQIDIFDVDNIKSQFTDILGTQAAETADVVIRDVISAGTNVVYAGSTTSSATLVDANIASVATSILTTTNLDLAVLKLKNAKAKKFKSIVDGSVKIGSKPIRDAYICMVHPNQFPDMKALSGFIPVEQYAYSKDIMEGEVGSYNEIRFVENLNLKVKSVAGTGGNSGTFKIVYCSLLMGEKAYAAVSVRGKQGTEMIFKALNSGGAENALNQKGSIGWKMYCGAKILNELFMARLETCVTSDVASLVPYES
jgi:N4-gp56 family major capsid protein